MPGGIIWLNGSLPARAIFIAPGISVKMLATDADRHMVSMLVRLVPGGDYPAHNHAGVEELHLLEGELWIDDVSLTPVGTPGQDP